MTASIGGNIKERLRNQPNGFAGLDEDGNLPANIINRSMTYAELIAGVVPAVGELVYCTDTRDLHIGDGVTVGGRFHSAPAQRPTPTADVGVAFANDTVGKLLTSQPIKAGCMYRYRIQMSVLDNHTTSNNSILYVAPLDFGNLVPTVRPWYYNSGWLDSFPLFGTNRMSYNIAAADPRTSGPVYVIDGMLSPTVNTNLTVTLAQQVSHAETLTCQYCNVDVQRIR